MTLLIVSCSLSPHSKSRVLATALAQSFEKKSIAHSFLDLADLQLPLCDGSSSYGHPSVTQLGAKMAAATGIVIATPIYNYGFNSAVKTMIEHVGKMMSEKPVGFLTSAGGHGSYMAIMSLANALMLDFRCYILPRFVYATGEDFNDKNEISSPKIVERLDQFSDHFSVFSQKLSK